MIRRRRRPILGRPWDEVECWALDLEMTGLDPRRDRIIAVGMVPVRDRAVRVGEAFASLVRPTGPVRTSGIAAHHLMPDALIDAPELDGVLAEVDRRLAGAVLVVHAAAVDLPFLRRAHRSTGRQGQWPDPPVVDTFALLRRHEDGRHGGGPPEMALPADLDSARRLLGLPPHDAHDALSDAVATAELLLVLAYRLQARTVADLAR